MRDAGHVVNDTPRQYDDKSTHSIMVRDPDLNYNLNIPLMLQGVISCFCSRQPTTEELNPGNCEWITMTMDEPWDPTSTRFKSREEELIPATTMFRSRQAYRSLSMVEIADDGLLYHRLQSQLDPPNRDSMITASLAQEAGIDIQENLFDLTIGQTSGAGKLTSTHQSPPVVEEINYISHY